MTILIVIITVLFFSNYFKQVHLLRLAIKTRQIALEPSDSTALMYTFNFLREAKQYEVIQTLLELETFDTMPSYADSCSAMTDQDYKNIVEYFYKKNEMEKLSKILGPDCLMSMEKLYFRDPVISFSLRDLPANLLAVDSFTFRIKTLKYTFGKIVAHALENRFSDINWDNLVRSPHSLATSQEHLPLSEALNSLDFPSDYKPYIFYYLGHSMLKDCICGDDIIWLVREVLPLENIFVPPNIARSAYVDQKIFSAWNEQLFRVVSTLAFYIELVEIQKISSKRASKQALRDKVREARVIASEALERCNELVQTLLKLNLNCKPFKQLLSTISALYSIFMTETIHNSNFVSQTYRSVAKTFSMRASAFIQGDWLCNLFFMFWKRKFRALKMADISESIQIFFSRNPTIHSIIKVHSHYVSAFNYISPNTVVPRDFEQLIPVDRLEQVYEQASWILVTRFEEITFEFRWKIHLKKSRKALSDCNIGNFMINSLKEQPTVPASYKSRHPSSYKKDSIESFQMAISSLNNYDVTPASIRSFSQFNYIGNNFIKRVGIREALHHLFKLILDIPDFRIILKSLKDGRPVIIITPMMSKEAANILGQALAAATILNVRIPFVIHKSQLEAIFKGKEEINTNLLRRIKKFCNKAGYLNLLSLDQAYSSHFCNSLEKYFRLFLSWANLFHKSKDLESDSETLIEESFTEFNSRIFAGFKLNYLSSRFTFEELQRILT